MSMTENMQDTDLTTVTCDVCHREFKNRNALNAHSQVHLKEERASAAQISEDTIIEVGEQPLWGGVAPPITIHTHQHAGAAPEVTTTQGWRSSIGYTTAAQAPAAPEGTWSGAVGYTAPLVGIVTVKVKKLPHYGRLPNIKRATEGSAAYDLYAAIDEDIVLGISQWKLIPTGLAVEIPRGWVGKVVPRSGLAAHNGITIVNTPGIIDSDYRGEIKVNLVNNTTKKFVIEPGMRIAQILFELSPTVEIVYVAELTDTTRGTGGFGHSGSF